MAVHVSQPWARSRLQSRRGGGLIEYLLRRLSWVLTTKTCRLSYPPHSTPILMHWLQAGRCRSHCFESATTMFSRARRCSARWVSHPLAALPAGCAGFRSTRDAYHDAGSRSRIRRDIVVRERELGRPLRGGHVSYSPLVSGAAS